MKSARLAARLGLSEDSIAQINSAITKAEAKTSGEIAVAVIPESEDYSFPELRAALLLGVFCFAVLLPFYPAIHGRFQAFFWVFPGYLIPAFYGLVSFGLVLLFFLLANLPPLARLVVSPAVRERAVYNRALRHFVESGVYGTVDRTGILIFVSWLEHQVLIIADKGINDRIDQEKWQKITADIAQGIKEQRFADALEQAVGECGSLLTEHFPADHTNPNELPDTLEILEAGS